MLVHRKSHSHTRKAAVIIENVHRQLSLIYCQSQRWMKILCKHFHSPRTFTSSIDLVLPTSIFHYQGTKHTDETSRRRCQRQSWAWSDISYARKKKSPSAEPESMCFAAVVFNVNIVLNSSTCLYLLFCEQTYLVYWCNINRRHDWSVLERGR